jgi:hypothetical protein
MTTGVLSWPNMRQAIMLNTGFFETSQYSLDAQMRIIGGNWDGAGMSVGNLQYNYAFGDRLSELWLHLLNNHDSVVRSVFGADTVRYDEFRTVHTTYSNADKISWANTITDWSSPNDGHRIVDPWKTILGNLLVTPECYAKYYEMMDAYYIPNALEIFKQLNCTSRGALASLFDLSVNRGRYYPCNTIVWEFENVDARTDLTAAQKEAEKIRLINNRGNDTTNGITATTWLERRRCMAEMGEGEGADYYGAVYDPETQFDINLEPAIPEKLAGFGADVKLGILETKNLYFGSTPVKSIYLGANLVGSATITPYRPATVPNTQFRTNPNSYLGFESGGTATINEGQKVWVDVQNFVACKTYYTTDGTTPTTASTRYTDGITFNTAGTFTLKALTVSLAGVAEAVKTCTITVNNIPNTTVSPTATVQNTIPFTVTLTTDEAGATIKYKLGTGATEYTYTGPFSVNQNSTGVASTQIKVTYWAVGANGTEVAKTITYDTSGSTPAAPVVTATAGAGQVALSWPATANTTSYTVYRSTTAGTLGTAISQYQAGTSYTATGLTGGTTYYFTVQAGNYGRATNSAQVSATPTAGPTGWRYVRYIGHGDQTGVTSRLVEIQALEGATNRLLNKTPMAGYQAPNSGTIGVATDGAKVQSPGYPLWWSGEGIPTLVYDMGAVYPIDTINVTGFSTVADPRQTQFKIHVSKDNTTWTQVADYSANTTNQPEAGFNFTVPAG